MRVSPFGNTGMPSGAPWRAIRLPLHLDFQGFETASTEIGLTRVETELKRWFKLATGRAIGEADEPGTDTINPRDMDILVAMLRTFDATRSDKRTKADDIAAKVIDAHSTGDTIKKNMQKLRRLGMTEGKTGPGGGIWLTAKGMETAQLGVN